MTLFLLQILYSNGKAIHGTFVRPNRKHEQDCHNGLPHGQLVQSSRLFGERKRGALNLICLRAVWLKGQSTGIQGAIGRGCISILNSFYVMFENAVLCTYLLTKYLHGCHIHLILPLQDLILMVILRLHVCVSTYLYYIDLLFTQYKR